MLSRFTSVLFRDDAEEEPSHRPGEVEEGEEQEEDWILLDFLADASRCSEPAGPEEEEEEEEVLVMIPSPTSSPRLRYASCSSLNSTAEADGGGEEEEEEEGGFLCVDRSSLEESWFVTPPPCFTGCLALPVAVETGPLENLLIEHPSMSVYACHRPRPLLPGATPTATTGPSSPGKKKGRHHRPQGAVAPSLLQHIQQQSGAEPLSPNLLPRQGLSPNALPRQGLSPNLLPRQGLSPKALPRHGLFPNLLPRQGMSPNALRRLNLRRQRAAKQGRTCPLILHQPRHLT